MKNIFRILVLIFIISCSTDEPQIEIEQEENPEPIAFFELMEIKSGKAFFNNLSENASIYKWDFGDSNYSNLKHVSHQYLENGTYQVKLDASFEGKSHTFILEVVVDDIFKDDWEKIGDFPGGKRSRSIHFKINNKYYVGYGWDHSTTKKDFWEYDSETKVWVEKKEVPHAIYGGVSFVINGTAYVGQGISNVYPNYRFWKYDSKLDVWSRIADFPGYEFSTITGASAFSYNGMGYVINGNENFTWEKEFWQYDPVANSWERLDDFPGKPRHQSSHFIINGKVYICGGSNHLGDGNSTFYNDFWEYDFETKIWTQKADFPGKGRVGGVGFVINNRGYYGLGWRNAEDYDIGYAELTGDLWEYYPITDSWLERNAFPDFSRVYSFVFEFDGYVWVGLGKSLQGKEQNDIWKYKIE
jgi:N-acetylneuraminic acid mutarotase